MKQRWWFWWIACALILDVVNSPDCYWPLRPHPGPPRRTHPATRASPAPEISFFKSWHIRINFVQILAHKDYLLFKSWQTMINFLSPHSAARGLLPFWQRGSCGIWKEMTWIRNTHWRRGNLNWDALIKSLMIQWKICMVYRCDKYVWGCYYALVIW